MHNGFEGMSSCSVRNDRGECSTPSSGCSSNGRPPTDQPMQQEETDSDLTPLSRDRCNTWPLRRPQIEIPSPLIHEQIPEEDTDDYGSHEHLSALSVSSNCASVPPENIEGFSPGFQNVSPNSCMEQPASSPTGGKKSNTRRNPWGNMSYADMISRAIEESPDKRLTLSQVYEWMVQNISFFRDKGDSNSSAGWKNSIRHNLSLHNRFQRLQNEGAGKSSWWIINPDAKPGRNPRRTRASTLDATNKAAIEKKRRGAKKKVMEMRAGASDSTVGSSASLAHELYNSVNDDDTMSSGGFDPSFRPRAQSSSMPQSKARSPSALEVDEFDFPRWVSETASGVPADILDRTDQMRIDSTMDSSPSYRQPANAMSASSMMPSHEEIKHIKEEPVNNGCNMDDTTLRRYMDQRDTIAPPPSYQELSSVHNSGHLQNSPLMRNQIQKHNMNLSMGNTPSHHFQVHSPIAHSYMPPSMMYHQHPSPVHHHYSNSPWSGGLSSCGAQQQQPSPYIALPLDLEDLNLPAHPLLDMEPESMMRLELSQNNTQLTFDPM